MAATPYSHPNSLRLTHLVRWAVRKPFKIAQSPLSPTPLLNRLLHSLTSLRRLKLFHSTLFLKFNSTCPALLVQAD